MKLIAVIISLCVVFTVSAQTETSIRNYYAEVNKMIAESIEQGFEGPLYQNQWVTNKNGRSWPAVGIYADTTDFWYDDDPNHLSASERPLKNVLLKVNISRRAAAFSASEEYLYRDGKLLFFYSHEGEEGNEWETRVYFSVKGVMFKSSVKANGKVLTAKDLTTEAYKDFRPNPVSILAAGKKYQELFVKSM
jgi:hypothetical protein